MPFDFDGNQLGCVQEEWEHKGDPRFPGSMDFDWAHNWDLASGCVRGVLKKTGIDPKDIAGGASKSPLWCQILADALGLPVKVPVVKEATALGAAILAGYGVGIYDSIAHGAEQCVKWDRVFEPNMDNHKIYAGLYPTWKKVYDAQLKLADEHLTKYMWAAPGIN